jgi:cytochrome c556
MRSANWLFLVSAALFVFGVGFVVVGAGEARKGAATVASAPAARPLASVKQIMAGIVGPSAMTVFDAVSTTVTLNGVEEKAPKTDEEWALVGAAAASLAESGQLLMAEGRAVDRGDWIKMSQAMIDAGVTTLKAVEAKDKDGVLNAGEAVNTSCDTCHRRYQRN